MAWRRAGRTGHGFTVPTVLPAAPPTAPSTVPQPVPAPEAPAAVLPTQRQAAHLRDDEPAVPTADALAQLRAAGQHVLLVQGPGRLTVLVGPYGVVVLTSRQWRDVTVERDRVLVGGTDLTGELFALAGLGETLTTRLAATGLAPGEVRLVVHVGTQPRLDVTAGPVRLVGDLTGFVEARGVRLNGHQVTVVRDAIAREVPVREDGTVNPSRLPPTAEPWAVWLDGEQAAAVTASAPGPLVVAGRAGSGASTVAVHRAVHLARRSPGTVLLTAATPPMADELRRRVLVLAPELAHRVRTVTVATLQRSLLAEAGATLAVDDEAVAAAWEAVWRTAGRRTGLESLKAGRPYWQDEVTRVIRSRGLTELGQYLASPRAGRLHPLDEQQRAQVWDLAQAYRAELAARGLADRADVAAAALAHARRSTGRYSAVVVDQVEDLDCFALGTVATLAGGALTFVGDPEQALDVDGCSLRELGVRPAAELQLTRSWRDVPELAALAQEVLRGAPRLHIPQYVRSATRGLRAERLLARVAACAEQDGPGSVLVVHLHDEGADETVDALVAAGLAARNVVDEGAPAVRVGTVAQVKGLEAEHVVVVDVDHRWYVRDTAGLVGPELEQDRLLRRRLHVAVTRARRTVWIGGV